MKVIMFVINGCQACDKFKTTFSRLMKIHSLENYIYNVSDGEKEVVDMARAFDICSFPTTLIINGTDYVKLEGNLSEKYLKKALDDTNK